jgi:glycerol-3-phosphate dehydrogenase
VEGAQMTDLIGGVRFDIRSRSSVVAAGPWTTDVIGSTLGQRSEQAPGRALAVNAVLDRKLADLAVGSQSRSGRDRDPVGGGGRYLFAAPEGSRTLLGTWYAEESQAGATPENGVRRLIQEFNEACPGVELSMNDVSGCQWGLLPLTQLGERGRPAGLADRPRLVAYPGEARHLLSVEGVKYTTARRVAQHVVDWVFTDLGRTSPPCRTAEVPLGGRGADEPLSFDGPSLEAEVHRAVRSEMAVKLTDIVFRRSTLGGSALRRPLVAEIAQVAGAELGWDSMRRQAEIDEVMQSGPLVPAEGPLV